MARLVDQVRAAILASDETPYAIAKGSGVNRSQLSRLLSGQMEPTVTTIEKVADYLGLRITVEPKTKPRKAR